MTTNKYVKKFKIIFITSSVISLLIILAYSSIVYFSNKLYTYDICFSSQCLDTFINPFDKFSNLIDTITKILTALATFFGVYYALLNYLSTSSTAITNVYLTHLNTFRDYVSSEQMKDRRIASRSIDILKWYNKFYPSASTGNFEVGSEYKTALKQIKEKITLSNDRFSGKDLTPINYNAHQSEMIKEFKEIGIVMQRLPKNDFYDVESGIIELVNKVNRELGRDLKNIPTLPFTKFK